MDVLSLCELIAHRIQKERLRRNFTQEEMASRIGLSRRAYQKVETQADMRLKTLVKILTVLGCENDLRKILAEPAEIKSLEDFANRGQPVRQRARKKS